MLTVVELHLVVSDNIILVANVAYFQLVVFAKVLVIEYSIVVDRRFAISFL